MKKINELIRRGLLIGILLLGITSCDRYEDDINDLRVDVDKLKLELSELRQAYDDGKIIKSVTPLTSSANGGYKITFSDESTIDILSGENGTNGKDGKTPYLRININNFWEISYDGGETFELLIGSDGNPICATGEKGDKGEDGEDGYSVRVVVNSEGYYVIETYNSSNEVIDTIVTSYNNNPQNAIQSIVEDPITGIITITMESGDIYEFGKVVISPTSIVVLDREISISHNGTQTIEFRVNPSNAYFNTNEISLDLVRAGTRANEVSYITAPVNYELQSVTNATDNEGSIKRGQFVATIKDLEVSPDYCDDVAIVISTLDANGNQMEVSSELIKVSAKQPSSLPKVYITTPNGVGITSRDKWVKEGNIRIVDENGVENLNVSSSFRGRGNSTWHYPKKPYAIKLDSKAEVLGMPKHKRWVLLANWMDRTLLRNAVAYEMARECMSYAPRGCFVELYLNGKHLGNYYLCEHIKIDENRVNIDEIEEDTPEEDLTGGYILEYDTYSASEINYFHTKHKQYPVTIKEPDEDVILSWDHPAFKYIQDYVNNVEDVFVSGGYDQIKDLIDIESYIDWYLVHEVAANSEPNAPKSCYMYKARNGKLYAGPVWDFDWKTFRPNVKGLVIKKSLYYEYLFTHNEFIEDLKTRWSELKPKFEKIEYFIREQAALNKESNEINIAKWPIGQSINGDEKMSYDEAIERMISAYTSRIDAVDSAIKAL